MDDATLDKIRAAFPDAIVFAIQRLDGAIQGCDPEPDLTLMNHIEGHSPVPGSWFVIGTRLSIYEAHIDMEVKHRWRSYDMTSASC